VSRTRMAALSLLATVVAVSAVALSTGAHAAGGADTARSTAKLRFEDPTLTLVYSGPDRDAQLYISTGSTTPMRQVSVIAPGGRRIITARFTDGSNLGQSDLRLDTPEPSLAGLRRAYPQGLYKWSGVAVNGRAIAGTARLSYGLLNAPVITSPAPGSSVAAAGAALRWQPVPGASKIHIEVEQVATKRLLTVDLAGSATSLAVPEGFLAPGLEYTMDVKAVGPNGNLTVSDVTFRTS